MRTLHVAALPYPSPQGTQGAIHAMLTALVAHGHDAHLLCYAHGTGFEAAPSYAVHRAPGAATGTLRSGPSLTKLWRDVGLARSLHALVGALRPDAVVAHHVEAAACALARARARVLFVAHTSLAAELPSYFPPALAWPAREAGGRLDAALVQRAPRTLAVSPLLADMLARAANCPVHALRLPWYAPTPSAAAARTLARRALGLSLDAPVLLYAGNLDAYQGLAPMLEGVTQLGGHVQLLVATGASEGACARIAAQHAPLAVSFAPLASERDRARAHDAADVALVPRQSPGGLPIKLLDALARGVPLIAARRALAGLPLDGYCEAVDGDAPAGWCAAITHVLAQPARAAERAARGRAYLTAVHAPARFVESLEAHVDALR